MSTYNIDDVVSYGKNGVCRITEIKKMKFDRSEEHEYYVLAPLRDKNATFFVPVDSSVLLSRMRKVMTKDEIDEVLDSAKDESIEWIDDKKQRNDAFRAIITEGNPHKILLLAHCIYNMKKEKEAAGRKLWACDESLLATVVKMISEEMSWSIGIPESKVSEYIRKKIETE